MPKFVNPVTNLLHKPAPVRSVKRKRSAKEEEEEEAAAAEVVAPPPKAQATQAAPSTLPSGVEFIPSASFAGAPLTHPKLPNPLVILTGWATP